MSENEKGIIEILLDYGFSIAYFIAGIFGALASLIKQRELSTIERIITVLSGGGTAAYITPMLSEMVNLSEGSGYGVGFIVGFAGLKLVEWILSAVRQKLISNKDSDV